MNNTIKARQVIAEARDLLGGSGILLENHVMRQMADIEAIHTFEGTATIQALIVGRDVTGVAPMASRERAASMPRRPRTSTASASWTVGSASPPRSKRSLTAPPRGSPDR